MMCDPLRFSECPCRAMQQGWRRWRCSVTCRWRPRACRDVLRNSTFNRKTATCSEQHALLLLCFILLVVAVVVYHHMPKAETLIKLWWPMEM